MGNSDKKIIGWAKEVLKIEAEAISILISRVDDNFIKASQILYKCKSRIVVTGMGKAGMIANKFSATLASCGIPSIWLHPAEALHGDLGRVVKDDVVVALSYSGETDEIKNLIPFLKRIGAKIISITGNKKSTLASFSDVTLDVEIEKEACSLGLAPTTSTTAMLALTDALSVTLQRLKKFKREDFALFHPQGSLGRKLLLRVGDIMRKGKSHPIVKEDAKISEVLVEITKSRAGAASVVDKKGLLVGIFTDGDLRRHLDSDKDLMNKKIKEVMTSNPRTINRDMLVSESIRIFEKYRIDELPVVDENHRPIGMLDVQDLLQTGVI